MDTFAKQAGIKLDDRCQMCELNAAREKGLRSIIEEQGASIDMMLRASKRNRHRHARRMDWMFMALFAASVVALYFACQAAQGRINAGPATAITGGGR
jgi:predicted dithiol-disulfide oxidoreductase (DUF899 family)